MMLLCLFHEMVFRKGILSLVADSYGPFCCSGDMDSMLVRTLEGSSTSMTSISCVVLTEFLGMAGVELILVVARAADG